MFKRKTISSLLKCLTKASALAAKNDKPSNFLLAVPEDNYYYIPDLLRKRLCDAAHTALTAQHIATADVSWKNMDIICRS